MTEHLRVGAEHRGQRFHPGDLAGRRILLGAREAAAATPPTRDRVVDLLRGASLAVVVLGHTLMAVVVWESGVPSVGNVLATVRPAQLVTWVLQVMPVFFAAGAVANSASIASARRRGDPWRVWMWGRTRRLMRPVVWYLAVWVPLVLTLQVLQPRAAVPLAKLSTQLLWFVAVYLMVVALTPLEVRMAERGWWPVAVMLGLAAVVDGVRLGVGVEAFSAVNFVLVWTMAATLGLVVRRRAGDQRLWLVAAGAVVVNVAVVALGPYPVSMVGMPGERISNMAPPTLALALHAVALVSALGALWPWLARWCERPRVWVAACAVGGVAMTLFLWHLTALVLVVLVQHSLGLDRPEVSSPWFWPATLAYLAVVLSVVLVLVSVAAPLEYLKVPWLEAPTTGSGRWRVAAAVGSVVLLAVGLLTLALCGMGGFPDRVTRFGGVPFTAGGSFVMVALALVAGRAGGARPAD